MGRQRTQQTHWLKGAGSMTWAAFTPYPATGKVHVLALLGAVYYVDQHMLDHEARDEWKRLRKLGWERKTTAQAREAGVDTYRLKLWISD